MKSLKLSLCFLIVSSMLATSSYAGIMIGGTRVIYDASAKDASLSVDNPDAIPYLIQTWVDDINGSEQAAPFIVTPPLYRLNGGQQSTMRIVYTGASLSDNQESLFFLNVKAIPSTPNKENILQVSIKSRMKLIYRPKVLKGNSPVDFAEKLSWRISSKKVSVTNPTPYYMNFGEVTVNNVKIKTATWVAPNSTAEFAVTESLTAGPIVFKLINDYGGLTKAISN